MAGGIPDKYTDLFQKRAFANLGTLMPDGRPQVTPVWCDFDGEHDGRPLPQKISRKNWIGNRCRYGALAAPGRCAGDTEVFAFAHSRAHRGKGLDSRLRMRKPLPDV